MNRPRPAERVHDPAREAAFDALRAVNDNDAYANLVLPGLLADRRVGARDAAFATELLYGTLRRRGSYDAVLAACLNRPLDAIEPAVLDVLRLGAHQLFGMRVAAHAAVDSSVRLVRDRVGHRATGLVNAVLRKVSTRELAAWFDEVAPSRSADEIGHLAVVHSHPRWIVEAFLDALGGDSAETERALAADNEPALVTLAVRPGRAEVAELLEAGARAGRWAPTAAVLEAGAPAALAAVRDGRAGVQDEGSQLVALALAAATLDGPDARWLDLCAGPGGKAALLGGLAEQRGAQLLAAELHPHRARLVAATTAGSAVGVVVADGTTPAWRAGRFDRVLVDAPCTGLGALRRRPESRWRRVPDDTVVLVRLQQALLRSALASTRPGGLVGYVTCSPHPAETRHVVAAAIADGSAERIDARPYLPGVPELGDGPDVQLWPHRQGTDAMYLSLLRRSRDH